MVEVQFMGGSAGNYRERSLLEISRWKFSWKLA
jgi:hypothetical protein